MMRSKKDTTAKTQKKTKTAAEKKSAEANSPTLKTAAKKLTTRIAAEKTKTSREKTKAGLTTEPETPKKIASRKKSLVPATEQIEKISAPTRKRVSKKSVDAKTENTPKVKVTRAKQTAEEKTELPKTVRRKATVKTVKKTVIEESVSPTRKRVASKPVAEKSSAKPKKKITSTKIPIAAKAIRKVKILKAEKPKPGTAEFALETSAKEETKPSKPEKDMSPIFKKLAEPNLPERPREDRARLHLQSPNRIFFYWSFRGDPYETLRKIFGNRSEGFFLAAKLTNIKSSEESIFPVHTEGSWWFDVESDSAYRAELGFQGERGEFIRLLYSNVLKTPRTSPSSRRADSANFNVTAKKFARALHVSGFTQDAYEVARAGDANSSATAPDLLQSIFGTKTPKLSLHQENELRFALIALATGQTLIQIRSKISGTIFDLLSKSLESESSGIASEKIRAALETEFEFEEEDYSPSVFGASLINFPKKRVRTTRDIGWVSSPPKN